MAKRSKTAFAAALKARIAEEARISNPRNRFVISRVTDEELEVAQEICRSIGVSLSDLIRYVLFDVMAREGYGKKIRQTLREAAHRKGGVKLPRSAVPPPDDWDQHRINELLDTVEILDRASLPKDYIELAPSHVDHEILLESDIDADD